MSKQTVSRTEKDTGIFRSYSDTYDFSQLSDEDCNQLEEWNERFKKHHDISYRLKRIEKTAVQALEDEGYSEELKSYWEGALLLLKDVSPLADTARLVLQKIYEIRGNLARDITAEQIAPLCFDLGWLHLSLLLKEKVEPKFKKHKDGPPKGGEARARKFDPVREVIFHENSKISRPGLSRSARAKIILNAINSEYTEDKIKLWDLTESKIYRHLYRRERKTPK